MTKASLWTPRLPPAAPGAAYLSEDLMLTAGSGQPQDPPEPQTSGVAQPSSSLLLAPSSLCCVCDWGLFKNDLRAVGVAASGCGLTTRRACVWALVEFVTNPADGQACVPNKVCFLLMLLSPAKTSSQSPRELTRRPTELPGPCLPQLVLILPTSHRAGASLWGTTPQASTRGASYLHGTLVNVWGHSGLSPWGGGALGT